MKGQGWLQNLSRKRDTQQQWIEWIKSALPQELHASVVNAIERGSELTVSAASANWGSRLRYALAAIEPDIRLRAPHIVKIVVRVSPRAQEAKAVAGIVNT